MSRDPALSRQILIFMLSLTLVVIIITIVGSYLFYAFVIDYIPGGIQANDENTMTFFDWLWIIMSSTASLLIAFFFTTKLSNRILNPLNSVATSLRRIAQGDLGARAFNKKTHLGELNNLVNDFNEMAEKLQTLDSQRKSWNASIAHELRTPVTILRGRLQGLVDGVFQPEPRLFKNLLQQTEGLSRLIDDLRIVGAADTPGFSLQKQKTAIRPVIESATDAFSNEFHHRGFRLVKEFKDKNILCDPLRIVQCLTALLDNAIKYSTPGAITIRSGESDSFYYIEIADSGPGISADFQKHMFEPFQRDFSARTVNPRGCGLGLSVVKAIMHAHGGDITYKLLENHSSLFILSWPVPSDSASDNSSEAFSRQKSRR